MLGSLRFPPAECERRAVEGSIDYQQIGLRVGLEVHQQLLTSHKMFCRCPAGEYTREHDEVWKVLND